MNDYVVSLIRTWVPLAVGALFTWLASLGLELGAEAQVGLVTFGTALVTGVYYMLVRALEQRWPKLGVLLGKKAQPAYQPIGS